VRREAGRSGVAAVPLERRDAALATDELLGEGVQLGGRHAGAHVLADERERRGDDLAGAGHPLDLGRGLADDHLAIWSSAFRISANTSSTGRSARMPTTLPC